MGMGVAPVVGLCSQPAHIRFHARLVLLHAAHVPTCPCGTAAGRGVRGGGLAGGVREGQVAAGGGGIRQQCVKS
ncbi:MAG: hypothetical protein ABSF69_28165, partial [Polyangiaceae bacterium]